MEPVLFVLISCIPLVEIASRPRIARNVTHPVNSLWVAFLYFGVLQPVSASNEWEAAFGKELFLLTLTAFLCAGAAIVAGLRSSSAQRFASGLPLLARHLNPHKLRRLGQIVSVVGISSIVYLMIVAGGAEEFFSESRLKIDYENSNAYLLELKQLPHIGLLFMILGSSKAGRLEQLMIMLFAFSDLLWVFYIGSRSQWIQVGVYVIVGYSVSKGRRPGVWLTGAYFVILALGVGVITQYREQFRMLNIQTEGTADDGIEEVLAKAISTFSGSYEESSTQAQEVRLGGEFGMTISMLKVVPEMTEHDLGTLLLEYATRPVPRSIWPDKRYPEGEAWDRFHRIAGTSEGIPNPVGLVQGPAPGLVAKYYYMWSWPGIIIGGYATGVLMSFLYFYSLRHTQLARALLVCAFVMVGFAEMNNPLMLGYGWLPTTGVPLALVFLLCRKERALSRATLLANPEVVRV